jgi:23S rRNA (adenine2503-C2)-methyltransferase
MSSPPLLYDLTLEQLRDHLTAWGEPSYRANQIWHALYVRNVASALEITDLPRSLRARLANAFRFSSLSLASSARSRSGQTEKLLLQLPDGAAIEAVIMRYRKRNTACISTQAGCAMACQFCATGQMGFVRHLSGGEIVEQVRYIIDRLAHDSKRLTNIVFMGMGEPFHNYGGTIKALDILSHPEGLDFGARRITISTVGLLPGLQRFTRQQRQVNLAVSLHAATNELRSQLLPINRRYPLEVLIPACRAYVYTTKRRLSFEWALIDGVNDGLEQAAALSQLLKGMNCHLNLIPLNPTAGFAGRASSRQRAAEFAAIVERHGISCTIRVRRGLSINAGCGQLATQQSHAGNEEQA